MLQVFTPQSNHNICCANVINIIEACHYKHLGQPWVLFLQHDHANENASIHKCIYICVISIYHCIVIVLSPLICNKGPGKKGPVTAGYSTLRSSNAFLKVLLFCCRWAHCDDHRSNPEGHFSHTGIHHRAPPPPPPVRYWSPAKPLSRSRPFIL